MDVLVGPTFSIDVSSYGPAPTQDNRNRGGLYLNQDRGAAVAEEASSDSSSSIGVPDDSEEEEDSKGDNGDEVQSKFNGGGVGGLGSLGSFGSLEDSLPIKRGLSNYFSGKSKSFASLSEVSSTVSSVKEVEKQDNPFNKRRRVLIASKWSRRSSSSSSLYNWPNPKSMPLLALAEDGDEDDDEHDRDREGEGENASSEHSSSDEKDDQERRRAPQKLLDRRLKSFKSKSCYCLSDLQEHDEQ
ncbi:suppressor protein SRP40-like [Pyrus ussuriensis x Pyrus communis]|uniref:Suppressor protein SRP40-like n=1 Tax=Pyrus ussuriensis x Pyrus communis TaxID=2448454 RepID=A0A5N5GV62_9ROSA|nr:suppressor protein SRP40-like [Pyrus ussuriensis x Pyrus communis]